MKKIIVTFGVTALCTVFLLTYFQLNQSPKAFAEVQQVTVGDVTIELGRYGNLTGLKNAKGENFFGKDGPASFDGYAIAYRIGEMQFDKNDVQIISAIKDQITKDKLSAKPGDLPQSVLARTTDGALLIFSKFSVDKQTGKLEVTRAIRNNSSQPVSLLAFEIQADPRFSRYKDPAKMNFKAKALNLPLDTEAIVPISGEGDT